MKFEVKHKLTGRVLFTAEIEAKEGDPTSLKLGLAVKWGVKNAADLRGTDLRGADLREVDLYGVDLYGADLREADLREVDLRGTNLRGTNLRGTNLSGVDLREVNLRGTNLRGADLREVDLSGTDLRGTNLRGTNLCGADLREVDLCGVDLRWADLRGTNLCGVDLRGTDLSGTDLCGVDLLVIHNIGSQSGVLIATWKGKDCYITRGCFEGSLDEFKAAVDEKHKGTKFHAEYMMVIDLIKLRMRGKEMKYSEAQQEEETLMKTLVAGLAVVVVVALSRLVLALVAV